MHFHWDNLDSAISKAFRSITPPLVNLVMISYIFYEGLGRLIAKLLSLIPAMSDEISSKKLEQLPELLANLLPNLADKFLSNFSIETAKDGATALAPFLQAFLGSALTAMIGLVVGVIIVAYLIDFAVRTIGMIIPIRADLDERRLVYHQSMDKIFDEAGLGGTSDRRVSRYFGWLSARMQAESMSKESSYYNVRSRLLAAASMNERAFAYFTPYLIFSTISMLWMQKHSFLLLVLVLLAGFILLARQFALGCEIIKNDLETFVAMQVTEKLRIHLDERLPVYEEEPEKPFNWMATFVICPPWMLRFVQMFKRTLQMK